MNLNDFNSNYLNDLLDKVSKEQKSVFLLGDFVVSNSFVPNILQPTWLTPDSETLIGNIFPNIISLEAISVNLTLTISDHLPQFMIVLFSVTLPQTRLIYLKEIGQTLINKTLFLITFLLIGM